MSPIDDTALQVYSVLFLAVTVVLVYTARYFRGRRGRRQRQLAGIDRIARWTAHSIETNRPLHLAFGGAGVGGDNTPAALAGAEFFHQVIRGADAGDIPPIVSMSAPATVPLGQDTLRRAWRKGGTLASAQWAPADLAYAGAVTASMALEEPAAHVMAGSFGIELALMLDSAERRGQPSLAVSDRLDGAAVAYALADEVLIGEELFAAPLAVADAEGGQGDAAVLDVWRALLIVGASVALLLEFSKQLPLLGWPAVAAIAAVLVVLGVISSRRR